MKIAKSVNRLGTEAVYSIFARIKKLEKKGKKIIDLSLGQSDFKSCLLYTSPSPRDS